MIQDQIKIIRSIGKRIKVETIMETTTVDLGIELEVVIEMVIGREKMTLKTKVSYIFC